MTQYILDTGFFVLIRDYYPRTFPSFWAGIDSLVQANTISSVHMVRKEIENYGGEQEHLLSWVKENRSIFTKPTPIEMGKVKDIFAEEGFQNLIDRKARLRNKPVADPFLIAKAIVVKAVVVTKELPARRDRNGNAQEQPKIKIPDVCAYFSVPCISPREFMEAQNWKF